MLVSEPSDTSSAALSSSQQLRSRVFTPLSHFIFNKNILRTVALNTLLKKKNFRKYEVKKREKPWDVALSLLLRF